jgi:hypothetical protein
MIFLERKQCAETSICLQHHVKTTDGILSPPLFSLIEWDVICPCWSLPVIPALRKHRLEDCEFEASLVPIGRTHVPPPPAKNNNNKKPHIRSDPLFTSNANMSS